MQNQKCKFVSNRNSKGCTENATSANGYCKKHIDTVQAKRETTIIASSVIPSTMTPPIPTEPLPTTKKYKETDDVEIELEPSKKKKTIQKISVNKYGRYEEPNTHIVFDFHSRKAYGVQSSDGKLKPLTSEHVRICQLRKWKYLNSAVETPVADSDSD